MPTLNWVGKDKVVNHHHDVPFRVLKKQYTFSAQHSTAQHSTAQHSTAQHSTAQHNYTKSPLNNRIIHGDNLEALKSLLPEFEGKINCIYIDPPYNTGEEKWKYNDNVNDPKIKKWLGQVVGKEGEDLSRHDKWLCMMYPRLKLLHRLLANDGVMLVSIDDIELCNLQAICDEIFGLNQKIGVLAWEKKKKGSHLDQSITNVKEYVLVYCKKKEYFPGLIGHVNEEKETYPCINPGNTISTRIIKRGTISNHRESNLLLEAGNVISAGNMSLRLLSDLIINNNILMQDVEIESEWRYSQDELNKQSENGSLYFTRDLYLRRTVTEPRYKRLKDFLPREDSDSIIELQNQLIKLYESNADESSIRAVKQKIEHQSSHSFLDFDINNLHSTGWGSNEDGDEECREIFKSKVFDFPKPSKFIAKILASYQNKNAIILDSFSGSGTTAHAVLKLNKKDKGNRKFILIETMDYAETITAERVRRVINGYGEGDKAVAGLGGSFDYYTVSDTLFLEDKNLNEAVGIEAIRNYVTYTEGIPAEHQANIKASVFHVSPYALGLSDTTLWLFYYEPAKVTTLDMDFLASINISHLLEYGGKRPESFIIYADKCALNKDFLTKHNITFKRIPRDITKF